MSAAKRMQFSLEVEPIPQVEMMKNMPKVVLPLFWVEESVYLNKDMTDHLKNSMFLYVCYSIEFISSNVYSFRSDHRTFKNLILFEIFYRMINIVDIMKWLCTIVGAVGM